MLGLSFITVTAPSTIFLPAGLSVALLKSNCGPCSVTSGSAFAGGGGGGGGGGAGGAGGPPRRPPVRKKVMAGGRAAPAGPVGLVGARLGAAGRLTLGLDTRGAHLFNPGVHTNSGGVRC